MSYNSPSLNFVLKAFRSLFLTTVFLLSLSGLRAQEQDTASAGGDEAASEETVPESPAAGEQDSPEDAPAAEDEAAEAGDAPGAAPEGDIANGEALFKTHCTTCHAIDRRVTGPALRGTNARHDRDWLQEWIKDSPAMIASGDETAVALFEEYNQQVMQPFPMLSDSDVDDILAYIQDETEKLDAPQEAGAEAAAPEEEGVSTLVVLGLAALVVLLFLVTLVLNRSIGTLEKIILKNKGEELPEKPSRFLAYRQRSLERLKKLMANKKAVVLIVLLVIAIGSGWALNVMWNVGVETHYQPKQPIRFSHQLHAGVNQIDCQYCHGGAWKSKNAGIPSANVCMNCHVAVTGAGSESPTAEGEISKIYTALDYDPETQEYGDNPRPVEWIRVHNLPDFAFFNHAQHVNVGAEAIKEAKGLKAEEPVCYACHGPVAEMEEIYQYSPLTMKWCIECHQETEAIHAEGNAYYDKILAAHEQIKEGKHVTVADLGGIECVRCHY